MHYRSISYICLWRSDVQYFKTVIMPSDQLHEDHRAEEALAFSEH